MFPTKLQPIITLKICKSFFWNSAEPNPCNYLQCHGSFDTFLGFKASGTLIITVADKVPMPTPHQHIQPVRGDKHT